LCLVAVLLANSLVLLMGPHSLRTASKPFARGGIVNGPTLFPFAKGIGLMGEAGPEAIMPLRRGRDGNLGVMSSGGGTTNVVVNVDASGSSVEGDQAQAKALGNAISAAVQSELVKQKRPGGLLA
jgi:phage-related minor tail protein